MKGLAAVLAMLGCVLGLAGFAAGVGAADDAQKTLKQGFSADIVSRIGIKDQAGTELHGKLYVTPDRWREEETVDVNGKPATITTILRADRHVQWMLMPEPRQYAERPLEPADEKPIADLCEGWVTLTPVGTEAVNGQPADKYDHSNAQCATAYTYVSSSSHLPLKTEATCADTYAVTEYQHVQAGAPPAELFELPAGYQKFTLPR